VPVAQISHSVRIELDGRPLAEDLVGLLVSVVVEDHLALPDLFVLTFRDPSRVVLGKLGARVGAAVRIAVVSEATPGGEPLLDGEVTALECEHDAGGTFTVVRGLDRLHRLLRGRRTLSYANVTCDDVARQVAKRNGLVAGRIDASGPPRDHIAQANCNDWQFLTGLAREVGFTVRVQGKRLDFFRPDRPDGAPAPGGLDARDPLQLVLGANLVRLRAGITSAEQVGRVEVRGWDPVAKRAVVGSARASARGTELGIGPTELAAPFGDPVLVGTDIPFATKAEVDRAAEALAEMIGSSFAELEGLAEGDPRLRAGRAVSLAQVGEPFDGKCRLTTTRHLFDPQDGYRVGFTVTGGQDRSLLGLASLGATNANATPSSPPMPSVAPAVVTDVTDPDHLGRVKVSLPWLADDYASTWARVVQAGAGPGRGALVVPEVGDEVLVAFEQGDVRRPFVLGGLYNGKDRPLADYTDDLVDAGTGAIRHRAVVSRRGHVVQLLDTDQAGGILLQTGDGKLQVRLSADTATVTIGATRTVEVRGDGKVTIKGGDIDLDGQNVTIRASGELKLSGSSVKVDGGATVEVTGGVIKLN